MRFPHDVPALTDGVVCLRAHAEGDLDAVLEQTQDPPMVEWTTVPVPSSPASARDYVTRVVPAGWEAGTCWAFAVDADDAAGRPRFCGTVDLRPEGDGRASIGFGAHPWSRGRGLMERACRLLLEWGFDRRRLDSVTWWAQQGNWASRRLAWRLGFSFDGTLRRRLPQRGELRDAWVGVLLPGDPRLPRSPWLETPTIEGPVVSLRPFGPHDATPIVQACNDERSTYWLKDLPKPYTHVDALNYLETRTELVATGRGVSWAVADPTGGQLVGNIALFNLVAGHSAEVGYWTHPAARGRGVMRAAVPMVLRHAFLDAEDGGLGLSRVMIRAAVSNTASRHVIESSGLVRVGTERLGLRLGDGALVDTAVYDQVAADWVVAQQVSELAVED